MLKIKVEKCWPFDFQVYALQCGIQFGTTVSFMSTCSYCNSSFFSLQFLHLGSYLEFSVSLLSQTVHCYMRNVFHLLSPCCR